MAVDYTQILHIFPPCLTYPSFPMIRYCSWKTLGVDDLTGAGRIGIGGSSYESKNYKNSLSVSFLQIWYRFQPSQMDLHIPVSFSSLLLSTNYHGTSERQLEKKNRTRANFDLSLIVEGQHKNGLPIPRVSEDHIISTYLSSPGLVTVIHLVLAPHRDFGKSSAQSARTWNPQSCHPSIFIWRTLPYRRLSYTERDEDECYFHEWKKCDGNPRIVAGDKKRLWTRRNGCGEASKAMGSTTKALLNGGKFFFILLLRWKRAPPPGPLPIEFSFSSLQFNCLLPKRLA